MVFFAMFRSEHCITEGTGRRRKTWCTLAGIAILFPTWFGSRKGGSNFFFQFVMYHAGRDCKEYTGPDFKAYFSPSELAVLTPTLLSTPSG
jgi:hypothetical protein